MPTYLSLLRGINVSGHRMIKMDALRKMYEELGFKNVRSYIQSENIIFSSKKIKPQSLEKKIADAITIQFGFEVPVLVLESEEWMTVIKNNPFVSPRHEDITKLHVTFLSEAPSAENAELLKNINYPPDEFVIIDKRIYLFCPAGYGNSKLSNTFFENKLKVKSTTRNWKTVQELGLSSGTE